MSPRTSTPTPDIFARTIPLEIERHYFGESRQASVSAVETTADKTLLSLTKKRLEMPEITAIRVRDYQFTRWLKTIATPWKAGIWLVPVAFVQRVRTEWDIYVAERNLLADAAAGAYPRQVEVMRARLGDLYRPLEYPTPEVFRSAYRAERRFVDFGVPNVLQQIDAAVWEEERVKLEAEGRRVREVIEEHLAGSLLRITDHLADLLRPRANGRRPALREGALDGLLQFLDTIAQRDVTGFRQLRDVTNRLRQTASGLSLDSLRSDDELRERTAAAMEEAREAVSRLVSDDTRRAIRVREEDDEPPATPPPRRRRAARQEATV